MLFFFFFCRYNNFSKLLCTVELNKIIIIININCKFNKRKCLCDFYWILLPGPGCWRYLHFLLERSVRYCSLVHKLISGIRFSNSEFSIFFILVLLFQRLFVHIRSFGYNFYEMLKNPKLCCILVATYTYVLWWLIIPS